MGEWIKKIESRCNKANQVIGQLSPILQHNAVPMKTKKHLIQSIFIPTLCYQCQTWTLTQNHHRKLVTTEMRCLRLAAGVSLKDKQRNENIRKRLGIGPVLQFIKRQQIKWFCHLQRMPINSLPYKAYNELANGLKTNGKPRTR
jgi:hypothetical protein